MRRFLALYVSCLGVGALAVEPSLEVAASEGTAAGARVTCRAADRKNAPRAAAQAPSAAACLEAAQRSYASSCVEGGLVAVSWQIDGELPVTCEEASSLRREPLPAAVRGRVKCSLAEKEGTRRHEAAGATVAECEERARAGFARLCAGEATVVTRFSLHSRGDRLACDRAPAE